MSLTSYLKGKENKVARFFVEKFPFVQPLIKDANARLRLMPTVRPSEPLPYPTVGMAIDYRIRYYFAFTPSQELAAWKGASLLCGRPRSDRPDVVVGIVIPGNDDRNPISVALVDDFFESLEVELARVQPWKNRLEKPAEDLLCRYCVVLALFEVFYRASPIDSPLFADKLNSVEDLLALSEPHWVDDLRELSWLFYDRCGDLLLKSTAQVLNPTFEGSSDVGGADGDLIVNHCLLDIKTTINPSIKRQWIYQLIGYALLDYSNQYDLKSVGLYMSRQGQLLTWPIPRLLSDLSGSNTLSLDELRTEFRDLLDGIRIEHETQMAKLRERDERRRAQQKLKWAREVVRRYPDTDPDSLPKRQGKSLLRALGLLAQQG